jgi:hypothetical protein
MVVDCNGPYSLCWLCFIVDVFGRAAGQGEERRALNWPFFENIELDSYIRLSVKMCMYVDSTKCV